MMDPAETSASEFEHEPALRAPPTVDGPAGLAALAFFARTVSNYAEADLEAFRRYGDVAKIPLPRPYLLLSHPRHVKHVLRTNVRNYRKSVEYDMLRPLLGDGIFVSEGELWTRQRRLLAPEFREQSVQRFVPGIVECAERLFAEWDEEVARGPVDVSEDMMRLTLWVVGRVMFQSQFQRDADTIGRSLEVCLAHATTRMLAGGLYPAWLPTRGNREAREAEAKLDAVILQIIRSGRAGASAEPGARPHDVLSRMILAKDSDSGASMTDKQLLDETKSLVLAGHETTSLALSWGFYRLAEHPEMFERLADEAARVLGDRAPTAEDIPRLPYARMVFMETMRLYPPVPAVSRVALEDDDVDGVPIAKGQIVAVAPYVTHRHPEFWALPERFEPERFSDERAKGIEPYSYFPFLLGRRACLGEHFAMIEGVLLFAMIARRYRMERADRAPIGTRPIATLRMDRPLVMRVSRRER